MRERSCTMGDKSLMLGLSVLTRNLQKYYDHALEQYGIGSGQLQYLFAIYEQEGITMQEVSRLGEVDKGTTTKSIQKLMEQGYAEQRTDENDRRVKRLYTTKKAADIMNDLYDIRNTAQKSLSQNVDMDAFTAMLDKVCDNSRSIDPGSAYESLRIGGLQKVTLLDYPDKVACTVFTCGCNLKCPFCHNRELVFVPEGYEFISPDAVLEYLSHRKGILDGVCISGGEPLLQDGLEEFMREIRRMGFAIKLDTNGLSPERLENLLSEKLLDYVAMDVKNTLAKYPVTTGLNPEVFDGEAIERSVELLKESDIDYEFRTTVVKPLHTEEDLKEIAKWLQGAKHYYLQQYQNSGNVIAPAGLASYSASEMATLLKAVQEFIPQAELRGVK